MKAPAPPDLSCETTRRQWILQLGEMVALAGVSGIVPDTATLLFGQEQSELPPGLFVPSPDDLVHALSSHKMIAPPQGSETDYAQPAASPFQPQFFSSEEFGIITRFAEIILGKVESDALAQTTQWIDLWFQSSAGVRRAAQHLDPLHRALAVAFYGESSVRELETADPASIAREGLAALHKFSAEKYGRDFLGLGSQQQTELLRAVSTTDPESPLPKFLGVVRGEVIRGYYTSAAGLKELDYKGNSYYGDCPGCEMAPAQS